jgi:hypothetical protein
VESFAVAITPGYSPYSSPYGAVINGGQWFTKDYTVDGTSGTADIQGNSIQNGPTMEAIQELQAQTSGLDAQSAITGGGVISFNLKSGTNQFHGSGFLFGVNELFNANSWTNNVLGLSKEKRRAWDFGGSAGGPIFKDKTFFFGAFERYIQNDFRLGGGAANAPTPEFLNGNFGALLGETLCDGGESGILPCSKGGGAPLTTLNNAGQTVPAQEGMIFDPLTGNQFTGNIIPSGRISRVSQRIVGIYRDLYTPQFGGLVNNLRGLISGSPTQTSNQIVAKLDHVLTERDRLSGSWIYNRKPRTLVDGGGLWQEGSTDGGPFSAARLNFFRSHQWRISESHTFSPTLLNVLNFTYNYDWQGDETAAAANWAEQLGFGATGATNFPLISFGSPQAGRNAFAETFIGNNFQGDFAGATIRAGNTTTWTKGRHNFNFGGEFIARQINSRDGEGALSFNFPNNTTGALSQPYSDYVGFGFASFLLGNVSTASMTTPFSLYGRRKSTSLFAQDSYKIRPNLTLNLGLRWDYNFRFHEKYGHWANIDLEAIDPKYGVPGRLVFARDGSDSFEKNQYATNFGPQIGIAYSPWDKLALRGSVGITYMPPPMPNFQGVPNGFAPGFQGINQVRAPFNWDGGYPGVFVPGNKDVDPTSLFPVTVIDPRALRLGYSNAFNFGAQYALTRDMRVELSYVGNRGRRLTDTALAWNQTSSSTFLRLGQKLGSSLNGFSNYVCSKADADVYGVPYPYSGFCGPVLAAAAPYPQFAEAAANTWFFPNILYAGLPLGKSSYDSMVVNVVKRTGAGLMMDMSYTFSRQRSNTFSAVQEGNGFYTGVQDFSNFDASMSVTGYDLAHIVKGYVSYELPFGKGRRWLTNSNRGLNAILGGWNLTWLLRYNTGQPFGVSAGNPYYPQWGNLYPNYNLSGFRGPSDPRKFDYVSPGAANPPKGNFYMPASVASNPQPGTFGKGPGNTPALRCPGSASENISLLKYFPFGSNEQYKLSFRAEFYNVFNRHEYSIQGCGGTRSAIGSSDFGRIWDVVNNPRTGQFAIRFEF